MDFTTWKEGYCQGGLAYKYNKTTGTYRVQGTVELDQNHGGCTTSGPRIIIHEILHALGFDHMQNRVDRDQYIRVNWDNIDKEAHDQFDTKDGETFGLPYDCASAKEVFGGHHTTSN